MGLAPGIANDMIKQFVQCSRTSRNRQSFRMAITDMMNILNKSGLPKTEWDKASRLALAYMFVGDMKIDEMLRRAPEDKAIRDVLEAMKGGLLDDAVNPNGKKAIEAIATKYRKILGELDDVRGIPNYVPNILTPQGQNFVNFQRVNKALLEQSKTVGQGGDLSSPVEKFLERFQKPRSTIEHVIRDKNGKIQLAIMESDFAYEEFGEAFIKRIELENPEYAQEIRDKKTKAEQWRATTEEQRQFAESHYLSPHEINYRVSQNKMFKNLTNDALNGNDFMHADVISPLSIRLGAQERKYARDMLVKYIAPHELRLDTIRASVDTPEGPKPINLFGLVGGGSAKITTANGTEALITNEGGRYIVTIGNTRYRSPQINLSPEASVVRSIFPQTGMSFFQRMQ
jgi:hypothetical protein